MSCRIARVPRASSGCSPPSGRSCAGAVRRGRGHRGGPGRGRDERARLAAGEAPDRRRPGSPTTSGPGSARSPDPPDRADSASSTRPGVDPPHEPRPRAMAGAAIEAAAARGSRLLAARARPRDRPPRAALPRRRGAPHRPDRRRGRAGHHQQRRSPRAGRRARRPPRRRRLARRARRDRRRRPDPGDRPAGRGAAGRGRDDEPDARRGLRGAAGRRPGEPSSCASTRRTSPRPASSRRRTRPSSPGSPTRTARSSSTTSGAARCSTRRLRARPRADAGRAAGRRRRPRHVQRRQARRRAPGGTGRRPGGPHRAGSGGTRWPGRCGRTRSTLAALAATLGLYRAGLATTEIPVWRMIARPAADAAGPRRATSWRRSRRPNRDAGRGRRSDVDGRRRVAARRDAPIGRAARRRRGAAALAARLRAGDPAVIGRIEDGAVVLDLRTVDRTSDGDLGASARRRAWRSALRMTVVVGTAGHIDHGKTTLLRALTGIDADRLPEERRRGHDDRRRLRPPGLRRRHRARLRRRPRPRPARRQHARRRGRDRCGDARRGRRRRAARPDARAPRAARRARDPARAGGRHEGGRRRPGPDDGGRGGDVGGCSTGTSLAGSPIVAVSAGRRWRDRRGAGGARRFRDRVARRRARRRCVAAVAPGDRPGLRGQGPWGRRDRHAARRVREQAARRSGSCRATGPSASARSRSTAGRSSPPVRGRTALNLAGVEPAELHRGLVLTDDPAVVASDRLLVRAPKPPPGPDAGAAPSRDGRGRCRGRPERARRARPARRVTRAAILRLAAPVAVAIGDRLVLRRPASRDPIVGAVVLDPMPARGISRRRQTAERVGPARRRGIGARRSRHRGRAARPPRSSS